MPEQVCHPEQIVYGIFREQPDGRRLYRHSVCVIIDGPDTAVVYRTDGTPCCEQDLRTLASSLLLYGVDVIRQRMCSGEFRYHHLRDLVAA